VQAQILNLLRDMQRELGLTYFFISHDLAVVNFVSDWIGVMYLGRLLEIAPAATLFQNPQHPYTRLLLDTVPDLHAPNRDRGSISGEIPNPIDPPAGCHFNPRCRYVIDRCKLDSPALLTREGGAKVACHLAAKIALTRPTV
jgi:oligopeptide/dipeptide ABC transporter ATP-binding protein